MEIIQRKEAKILGLKRYFTNKPCPKGHISERMVSNKCCIQCLYFNAKTSNGRLRQRG